ncbi:MAG TPA: magnesium-translocating P-type ATPase [Polyangiaceae bacterium]|nr:magnesium-translocating P-type ATPase [Polyangiaceae bacterium]
MHLLAAPLELPTPERGTASADVARGLGAEQVQRLAAEFGPNEPLPVRKESVVRTFLVRSLNPLVTILVLSSIVSAALGDVVNTSIVLAVVVLSVAVEYAQTRRSTEAVRALSARVAQTATVRRDGTLQEIARSAIVPGDVVLLSAGNVVPADGRVVDARDLHVNEAALTGESLPVERSRGEPVLMGTAVVSGTATVVVETIGPATAFGGIMKSLALAPPPTEFERGVGRFGMFISKTVVFLVLFVLLVSAALGRNALESLLFGVALAVGLTPEFLPMITSVTLAKGAVGMAEQHVVVKRLAAIQNLGSMDVLCADKTGTLTTASMTLDRHVNGAGADSDRPLLLGAVNSYFESGVEDPEGRAVLGKARLDPLDSAVLEHEHPDISGFSKIDEIPFDFERRRVSIVARRGDETLVVTKGAPESVLGICTAMEIGGAAVPLDEERLRAARRVSDELGQEGYRVLAVAHRSVDAPCPSFGRADERDLVLTGFLAFVDPPRADAERLVGDLRRAGVSVKILTGDGENVTRHVCGRVGFPEPEILTGADVDRLGDGALAHEAERVDVFARVSPAQKNRILVALRARGHVVGFLGDGINDAPSLHAADVGISVSTAVDVARDAAEVILLEPGLGVLLSGILEGRRAFGNVMKYLLMETSSAFGNMLSMAAASTILPFLPMLPKQILLNNFLYDVAQVAIPSDSVDPEYLTRPRRWDIRGVRRFMIALGPLSSLYDFLTFAVLLRVFRASETQFHTGWFMESVATQALVVFVIRTGRNPFRSRPSRLLTATTVGAVLVALSLPFAPGARWLGFEPPPVPFLAFIAVATVTYLALVQLVKRRAFSHVFA